MHQKYHLSHADAAKLVAWVQSELEKTNRGAAIAVVDIHGELLAFLRTDGCPLPSIIIAMNKAYTAARESTESAEIGRRSREENWQTTNFGELRYVTWGGGVPLVYKEQIVGAIGISGLPEQDDIDLAREAAKLITMLP